MFPSICEIESEVTRRKFKAIGDVPNHKTHLCRMKRAVWGLLACLVSARKFERVASSTTGWYVLDKACFGYAEGPDSHQGELNLRLVPRTSPPPQQMQVLLFDDEPSSFPSVSDKTPCSIRARSAKNYADKELHTVRWVNNQWVLPTITISNSYKPRYAFALFHTPKNMM